MVYREVECSIEEVEKTKPEEKTKGGDKPIEEEPAKIENGEAENGDDKEEESKEDEKKEKNGEPEKDTCAGNFLSMIKHILTYCVYSNFLSHFEICLTI